jgi:uncharacterized protein YdaL
MNNPHLNPTGLRRLSVAAIVLVLMLSALPAHAARRISRPAKPPKAPVLNRTDAGDGRSADADVPHGAVGTPATLTVSKAATGTAVGGATTGASALILYDTTGQWGWLGEAYATMTANLTSQFGSWTAKPVSEYQAGDVNRHTATIYVGSTYDEPLPTTFLDDVATSSKPVVWMYNNIWQLTSRMPTFADTYGWMWSGYDLRKVDGVTYKGVDLSRDPNNGAGIMNYATLGPDVKVLAQAKGTDGSTFPWAVRSRNLTYIGEIPFAYFNEGDRMMVFADLLFDTLAPTRSERHRALVRIEDVSPTSDPARLRAIADYLSSKKVPFSVATIAQFRDPKKVMGNSTQIRLVQRQQVVSALRYMQSKGGVIIEHGWTHQYSNLANPYNGVSGDDTEFYRVRENADKTLTWVGPVPEDSPSWVRGRLDGAAIDFLLAGFAQPKIFEFPHYTASATAYREVAKRFTTRYDRTLYFPGVLTGGTVDHSRIVGQMFPYVVKDVYGTKVLPENLGNIEPEDWFQYPKKLPADIIRDAKRNLVVRDGFASFYFHPFLDISYLKETVEGIQAAGYTFVSPTSL